MKIIRIHKLTLRPVTDGLPLQLHPEKEDQFFLKEIEAQVNFKRKEKKEVK